MGAKRLTLYCNKILLFHCWLGDVILVLIGKMFVFSLYYNFAWRILYTIYFRGRSQWPRGLRRRSAAARLLRSWVRIPPGAWVFVCCECCVLSGRGPCEGLITRPEESYRLWCEKTLKGHILENIN